MTRGMARGDDTDLPAVHQADEALPADRPRSRKLTHLQVLRAIAASMVVLDHGIDRLVGRGALPRGWLQIAYHLGWMGVAVFFVTSGLIMYLTSHRDFGSPANARRFALRRLIRVAPLYWIATAVTAATQLGDLNPAHLVKSLLFIPYATHGEHVMHPVLGVGWTLNYEMFFYAVFAVALLLPHRIGLPALMAVLVGLVAIGGLSHSLLDYVNPTTVPDFYTDPILLLFAAGVLLGWAEVRRPSVRNAVMHPLLLAVLLLGIAVGAFILFDIRFPLSGGWQALFGVLAVLVVAGCTSGRQDVSTPVGRLLERAGDASYSTYLFHIFVVVAVREVWFRLPLPHGSSVAVAAFLMLVLLGANVAGWLLFRAVERPLTLRLRRMTDRRPTPALR